jgi:hypothetical protein
MREHAARCMLTTVTYLREGARRDTAAEPTKTAGSRKVVGPHPVFTERYEHPQQLHVTSKQSMLMFLAEHREIGKVPVRRLSSNRK